MRVPGSKSATNRAYVLAALAEGTSRITAPLASEDTDRLLEAISTLGAGVRRDGVDVVITGCGGRFPGGGRVDLGDGGTPTRFVLALAALAAHPVEVDGSARMRERPVDEGIALLRRLGARIEATSREGIERLPVLVTPGTQLAGGSIDVGRTASSQFLSALLLVGPACAAPLVLRYAVPPTSASYLDLTAASMRAFGIEVGEERDRAGTLLAHRVAPQRIAAHDTLIEPDASSAAYFALAAAILPGSRIELVGLRQGSIQPDLRLLGALESMGARLSESDAGLVVEGPQRLRGIEIDASLFPDASMALAIACSRAEGPSRITGLATLRVKETDRIAALAAELERTGCPCAAGRDSLSITPASASGPPVVVQTYRDHRMAMSFAVLGLVRPGIAIADPGCVAKSYPGFFDDLASLCR